jgi:hypothetical protein
MTAINRRPRRRKVASGAALLAPVALLGARRAVRAAALRRNETPRGAFASGPAATVGPTEADAMSPPVGAAPANVETSRVGRASGLPVEVPVEGPSVAERPRWRGRALRLALAAASVALFGAAFVQYAQSQMPRPTLVLEPPTNFSPSTGLRSSSSASSAPAPRRSSTQGSSQTLRQHHPKHQSRAGVPSNRRATQPVLPAKHASERLVAPVQVVGGRALHRLRWNAVAGATYYNLVLWRDGKRVLDLWPTSPRVVLPTTSVNHGPQARLSPGRYLWFVYPGFEAKPARQYGALAGTGVLVVQPKGGK